MHHVPRGEPERARDILPHRRGGAAGERDGVGITELVAYAAELPVARAKVVPPFADAVGLVHREERGPKTRLPEPRREMIEPLG